MKYPPPQLARLSTERCSEVEQALITSGHLPGKPSASDLFRHGCAWHLATASQRFEINVSLTPAENSDWSLPPATSTSWTLRIELAEPVHPRVAFRTPPSEAQLQAARHACHELALLLHEALYEHCPELRWETTNADGQRIVSAVPIPPEA